MLDTFAFRRESVDPVKPIHCAVMHGKLTPAMIRCGFADAQE